MVNPDKHKRKAVTEEMIQDLDINIINILNTNPDGVIKELTYNNAELVRLYNKMVAKEGSVLSSSECRKLISYIFRTDYSLESIKTNYNAIKLEADVIDKIKGLCYEALDVFRKIQELQNNNIDNPDFLSYDSIVAVEITNSSSAKPMDYYFSEEFENLIRLRTDFRFSNVR